VNRLVLCTLVAVVSCAASNSEVQTGGAAPPSRTSAAHVVVSFTPRVEAKFGGPIELDIQLRNDGATTATIPSPNGQWLTPEILDAADHPVSCHKRAQNFMPVLKKLEPGQTLSSKVDLASWCTFPGPAEYRATIHYETRGETMTPVTGTGTTIIVLTTGN
jgi:hypothetical protein